MQYKLQDLHSTVSRDGWVRCVDGRVRAAVLKKKRDERGTGEGDTAGEVPQHMGVSAIDNSVLRSHFSPIEARMLLAGGTAVDFVLGLIRIRQCILLKKIEVDSQPSLRLLLPTLASPLCLPPLPHPSASPLCLPPLPPPL